jgi:hypothetical protein
MRLYASLILDISTEITSSDQKEEMKIFEDIMKLVPSFKQVVIACTDHRRALLNLIRMVSFIIIIIIIFLTVCFVASRRFT